MTIRKIAAFGIAAVIVLRTLGALTQGAGDLDALRLAQAYASQQADTRALFAEAERAPDKAVSARAQVSEIAAARLLSSVTDYSDAAAQPYQPERAPIVAPVKPSKPEKSKPETSKPSAPIVTEPESYYVARPIPTVPASRKPIETSASKSSKPERAGTCRDANGRFAKCPQAPKSESKPSKSSACPASKPIRAEDGSCVPKSFYDKTDYAPVARPNSQRTHDFYCKPDGCYVTVFATGKTHKLPKQYSAEDSGYMGWLRSKGFIR